MKSTPVERKPNFDRWIEARIAKLSNVRRKRVKDFVEDMQIAKFSPWTIKANIQAILTLGNDGKAYEELTREDLTAWMRELDSNGYRPETIQSYRRRTKRFLRWIYGCRTAKDPTPEFLRCIIVSECSRRFPGGILSSEEIQRILAACEALRNRALVHVCYEGGCRSEEALTLRLRDVMFDRKGAVIMVSGKTGERRLRLVESVHDLQNWTNIHPNQKDPDAWLFPTKNGKPIGADSFNRILKAAARKVGLKKRIYPHLLRHSRATFLAGILTEHQLRVYFGWTKTSDVPAQYVHLSGRDVDGTLLKHYGVSEDNGRAACPRCGAMNDQDSIYCMRCSAPLTVKEVMNVEEQETIVAKVVKKLIEMDPDLVNRAMKESGAVSEIKKIKAGVS